MAAGAPPPHRPRGSRPRQGGAYAVEFAVVFPVFFALLYALLSYGIVFSLRLGLQNAAEEGARAGLRHQASGGSQLPARISAAKALATSLVTWLPVAPEVSASVCRLEGGACTEDGLAALDCGVHITNGCQMTVTVTYPYGTHPVAPALPGFGIFMPETLVGQASMLLDGRAL